jgi:subtilase family serine protease
MRLSERIWCAVLSLLASLIFSDIMEAQIVRAPDPLAVHASSRISGSIDEGALHLLRGDRHRLARPEFDAGPVAAGMTMEKMVLVLQPSEEQQAALDALIAAQHDPNSPQYHQWLTPEEYAEHFGASEEDLARIGSWLQSHGFSVDQLSASRSSIVFSGTAEQVERAFATRMRQYRVKGALHIANATEPSIPAALAPVVKGVLSLHDFRAHAQHLAAVAPSPEFTFGATHFVTPADLALIYDVNPLYSQGLTGSGESIAVVARSNIKLSDVRSFRSSYGLPANDPQVIVNGADPGTSNNDELTEATLDAEWAGALAKNATVKFVASSASATTDGTFLSAQYIVNQNLAPVMTMSFGVCEADLTTSGNAYVNALWQQAAVQGITVLVAAGDSGAAECDDPSQTKAQFGAAVNGLCSTAYNVCVGGTEFNDTANPSLYWSQTNSSAGASALQYIPETVWNESGSASGGSGLWAGGGGASKIYSKPSWQSGKGVPADGKRDVPDLSLTAAGHDGYMIVINGAQYAVGGTSAASPTLAGIFALVAQSAGARVGLPNSMLYALASSSTGAAAFHDITTGSNSVPGLTGYSATAGYDPASGLGSVDASALVAHWGSSQNPSPVAPGFTLAASGSPLALPPGSSHTLTLAVSGNSSMNSSVSLKASGLPSGMTASFSPASIAAPGSGSSTLTLAASPSTPGGSYTITVTATAGSLSKSVQLTVTVPVLSASLSASSLSLARGNSAVLTLSSKTTGGFSSAVSISIAGLPAGVTAALSASSIAAPGNGSLPIKLTAASSAATKLTTITVTASGGGESVTLPIALTVTASQSKTSKVVVAKGKWF